MSLQPSDRVWVVGAQSTFFRNNIKSGFQWKPQSTKVKKMKLAEIGCLRDQFMMITEEKRRWQSAANWLLILNGWHFCHHHSSWLSSSHKMRKMRQARNKEIPTQDDSPFLTSDSFVRQLSNWHKAWGNCVKRKLTQWLEWSHHLHNLRGKMVRWRVSKESKWFEPCLNMWFF